MLTTKQIITILEEVEGEEEQFIDIFDSVIKTGLLISRNNEELLEECHRLFKNHDSVFQFTATDVNLSFFLKIMNGTITYTQGIYHGQDIPKAIIVFPKDIILQVIKQEVSVESLYNKGIIKLKGSFAYLMRLRALGKYYVKYIEEIVNKK